MGSRTYTHTCMSNHMHSIPMHVNVLTCSYSFIVFAYTHKFTHTHPHACHRCTHIPESYVHMAHTHTHTRAPTYILTHTFIHFSDDMTEEEEQRGVDQWMLSPDKGQPAWLLTGSFYPVRHIA